MRKPGNQTTLNPEEKYDIATNNYIANADLLEPEFEKLKETYKDIAKSDEDVLSLALFENVARDFLKKKYQEEIVSALMQEFNYKTVMQVPRLEKIVINEGLGQAISDKKLIDIAIDELTNITGQKAVPTTSKKDISNFKLRKKMQIGVRVTLRRDRMYEFLERLVAIALPRIRDFRGVNYKFDGKGNYTLGVNEQIIFPEIDIDKINRIMGMDITFVTSAKTDEEGYALLKHFGVPFKNLKKN